jgi:hypothetical protein
MGVIGTAIGTYGGAGLGEFLGKSLDKKIGSGNIAQEAGKNIGRVVGGAAGSLLPFKLGGKVPGPKGKPVKALVHGGEYILPAGVKPTKAQKMAVAKLHKKK